MRRTTSTVHLRGSMPLRRLLKGFNDFRLGYFAEHQDLFERLSRDGQAPKILLVGCADARVDPGIVTQTRPGELFTVRNVAALVPPAQYPPDMRHHGTSAAIEFAVRALGVEHVVVLGHALCGGIRSLVDGKESVYADYDYLASWTAIAQGVRDRVVAELPGRPADEIARAVEQASVLNSVTNLMSFRWLAERVEAGTLVLHAWWFNMTEGSLYAFDPAQGRFSQVRGVELVPAMQAGSPLSAVRPERLVETLAGKPPAF
ncbi:MAG: carbonic anhydrase [Alphaproteobacteria bacterium]|nr:carbonic anhydrase [Alphaproteobacteria bacterium]